MRTTFRGMVALGLIQLALAGGAAAQESVNQGTLSGRVLDAQAAAVPGAVVMVRQTATNVVAETVTNDEGRFRFPYLRIGPYELRVRLQGFKESAQSLVVSAG